MKKINKDCKFNFIEKSDCNHDFKFHENYESENNNEEGNDYLLLGGLILLIIIAIVKK